MMYPAHVCLIWLHSDVRAFHSASTWVVPSTSTSSSRLSSRQARGIASSACCVMRRMARSCTTRGTSSGTLASISCRLRSPGTSTWLRPTGLPRKCSRCATFAVIHWCMALAFRSRVRRSHSVLHSRWMVRTRWPGYVPPAEMEVAGVTMQVITDAPVLHYNGERKPGAPTLSPNTSRLWATGVSKQSVPWESTHACKRFPKILPADC